MNHAPLDLDMVARLIVAVVTELAGREPRREPLPVSADAAVMLTPSEREVLAKLENGRLTGKRLCVALRWPYNGTSRTVFARMIERGLIDRTADGYGATGVGIAATDDDDEDEPHADADLDGDSLTDEQLAERIAAARSARLNGVNGHAH